ncbi:MAG: hypothetical protein KJ676_01595 [Alphaproteobacteria bacterium]|nr:hypothetical protein [Alphaproteobacteria bacterium]MBU1526077.1 hypothetical protein [Alphaproteobacteria bacterium]MBU2116870.1 hypothetical protein [Alphaproteobacteria bacterium]MBU2350610.1 hypothetical protein [Alphaproteobacteria bacterium]MBU2382250.1 hypothetical protein [Alphaproteobacteria bacterium]
MRLILPSLAALALAACGESAPAPSTPAPPPSPTLGGVDLGQPVRALGTEPFWAVDIGPDGIAYEGVDIPREVAPRGDVELMGTLAVFTGATDTGRTITVTLIDTDCSDGMSDRLYPLTARVEIGDKTLQGCAASRAAVMASGESGPVAEPAPAAP